MTVSLVEQELLKKEFDYGSHHIHPKCMSNSKDKALDAQRLTIYMQIF
jgi:hypothetical protein